MTLEIAKHLRDIRQRAGVKVPIKRKGPPPKQIYPRMIEHDYSNAIAEVAVRALKASLAPLMKELPSILDSARASRADERDTVFAGYPVVIENEQGSTRHWEDADGTKGETLMKYPYGFIDGYVGADGEEPDVYLGPDEGAEEIYVIHQNVKGEGSAEDWDEYDEDKIMLGFSSADAAKAAYLEQYDDPRFYGGMTVLTKGQFLDALEAAEGGKVVHRMDADEGKKAKQLIADARKKVKAIDTSQIEGLARKFAEQTKTYQRVQLSKQVRHVLGVDLITKDKAVKAKVEHFVAENASLIESLQDKMPGDIEKLVMRAITTGQSIDDLAEDIDDRFDVGENHARLIARDQIGKLYGQVNTSRQKELGVKRFIWRTVGDERVRDEHEELEAESDPAKGGEPFSYDDPPDEGMPGEPIQCRCTAEPVFEGLEDDSDSGDDE